MNEAHGMADFIAELFEKIGVRDNGAQYAITVTDTAGNVAEVFFEKSEAHGGPRWIWEEGCNVERLNLRVAHATRETARYVQLPGEALEKLKRIAALFLASSEKAGVRSIGADLQVIADAARWIA